jgi:hypothetical protein
LGVIKPLELSSYLTWVTKFSGYTAYCMADFIDGILYLLDAIFLPL